MGETTLTLSRFSEQGMRKMATNVLLMVEGVDYSVAAIEREFGRVEEK